MVGFSCSYILNSDIRLTVELIFFDLVLNVYFNFYLLIFMVEFDGLACCG